MSTQTKLHFLEDRWDEAVAASLDGPDHFIRTKIF